jgi:hypothetical protein
MTWTPNGAGSYIKFYGASDAEKNNLIDSAKSGTPTFASGDVTVPVNTGAVITNVFRNTTAATFYGAGLDSIGAVDTSGLQGEDYLKGDGTALYSQIPIVTLAVGDSIEMDIVFNPPPIAAYFWDVVGSPRSYCYCDSIGRVFYPTGMQLQVDGSNASSGATVLVSGRSYTLKMTQTALSNNRIGVFYVFRSFAGNFNSSIFGNIKFTRVGGDTIIYTMSTITDNGDGTGTEVNTGTETFGDMTISNFVAATDIVAVANNTFSYDLSEGSGTTLGSTPSGKNITLVNNPTWN